MGLLMDHKADDGAFGAEPRLRVRLMAPTNGASYVAPATIVLAATLVAARGVGYDAGVADPDAAGRDRADGDCEDGLQAGLHEGIAKVEFLDGETLIGAASGAPYACVWINVPSGSHALSARVTNLKGEVVYSACVSITVDVTRAVEAVAHACPNCSA